LLLYTKGFNELYVGRFIAVPGKDAKVCLAARQAAGDLTEATNQAVGVHGTLQNLLKSSSLIHGGSGSLRGSRNLSLGSRDGSLNWGAEQIKVSVTDGRRSATSELLLP